MSRPGARPIHHVGYSVASIDDAAAWFAQAFGAGPFFSLGEATFDVLEHHGAPARFEHAAAFGQWGPVAVELQHITRAEPAAVARALQPAGPVKLNHVSYLVDDLAGESERLVSAGLPEVLRASHGPLSVRVHDAPLVGHAVELHERSDMVEGLFELVRSASEGWDGTDPLRPLPLP